MEIGHTVGPRRARIEKGKLHLPPPLATTSPTYVLTDHDQLTTMSETLPPRRLPSVLLFALVPLPAWFIVRPLVDPVPPLPALYVSFGFSIFALLATIYLVPALGPSFVKANLKGRDLLKVYSTPMYITFLQCATLLLANAGQQT